MASLSGVSVASSYTSLLKLNGNTDTLVAGNNSNAIQVVDGDGTASPLYLNTDRLGIGGQPSKLLHLDASSGYAEMRLSGSSGGGTIEFYNDSTALGDMYFDTNKKFYVRTGGATTALTIDENQNATIAGDLTITGGDIFSANLGLQTTSGTGTIYLSGGVVVNDAGHDVDFRVESDTNTHAFFVQGSDGNVHIGGSNPTKKLEVAGDIKLLNGTNNITVFYGGDNWGQRVIYNTGNMDFFTNGTNRLSITSAGSVGIGTGSDTIDAPLHVKGGTANTAKFQSASGATNISLTDSSDSLVGQIEFGASGSQIVTRTSSTLSLGSNNVQTLHITDDDRVGIGTASPTDAGLHINGSGNPGRLKIQQTSASDYSLVSYVTPSRQWNVGVGGASGASELQNNFFFYDITGGVTPLILDANSRISLSNNDSGTSNTIFGKNAGASLNAGSNYNTFIGDGVSDASMDNAISNVGVGFNALTSLTSGDQNVALGTQTLNDVNTGSDNVAVGYNSGSSITSGTKNTIVGYNTDVSDVGAINRTGLGNGITLGADNSVTLGNSSVTAVYMAQDSGARVYCARIDAIANLAGDYAVKIHNDGNNSNRFGLEILSGADDASGTNYAVGIKDGDGSEQGYITFTSGTVTYGAFTANHDVELPTDDKDNGYPYGTLVEHTEVFYKQKNGSDTERGILYKAQKSSSAYAKNVLGAYAGKYPDKENLHQVYILGDGHILCNGEKGNIAIGDGICTSSTDGQGMKADKMAMCIGIAQEDVTFDGNESKLVAVQYGLQQFTPWN
jgi:hypothetical protein